MNAKLDMIISAMGLNEAKKAVAKIKLSKDNTVVEIVDKREEEKDEATEQEEVAPVKKRTAKK